MTDVVILKKEFDVGKGKVDDYSKCSNLSFYRVIINCIFLSCNVNLVYFIVELNIRLEPSQTVAWLCIFHFWM